MVFWKHQEKKLNKNFTRVACINVDKWNEVLGGIRVYIDDLIFLKVSSSSSCRAAITDIPDPLSPLLPIIHCLWQVFRAISRILT